MEFTLTFGAVGDFLAIGVMINDLITILDDARGSAREYRGVVSNLRSLLEAITQADMFYQQARSKGLDLEGLDAVALRTIEQVRQCVDGFLEKLRGFAPSLSNGGSGNKLKDALKKVQWRLEKKEIEAFQSELLSYTGMVQVFIQITTLRLVEMNHQAMIERLDKLEDRNEKAQAAQANSMQGIVLHVGRAVLSRLSFIAQLSQDLGRSATQLMSLGYAICGQLQDIQSMMAVFWVDQGIIDKYFILDDHFGGQSRIFLSNITSWNSFFFVMSENYKGKKGARRISQRQFVLEQNKTNSEISTDTPWEHAFLPRQVVHLSLICRQTNFAEDERACPRCHTICDESKVITVTCQVCGMHFTRSVVLPEELPTAPGAESSNEYAMFPKRATTKQTSSFISTTDERKKTLRERTKTDTLTTSSPADDSDSDEDDVAGLARIRVLAVLAKQRDTHQVESADVELRSQDQNTATVGTIKTPEVESEWDISYLPSSSRISLSYAPVPAALVFADAYIDQRRDKGQIRGKALRHASSTNSTYSDNQIITDESVNRSQSRRGVNEYEPTVHIALRESVRLATDGDAKRYKIPPGYSLKNWDPEEEPVLLLGSVFDLVALGKWIYDWTVFHQGPDVPISDMAGELWMLLIQLAAKTKQAHRTVEGVESQEDKELLLHFADAGNRLTDWLRKLLKRREGHLLQAARQGGDLGKDAGVKFVETLFSRGEHLDDIEKLMQRIRLFNLRFDANCGDLVRDQEWEDVSDSEFEVDDFGEDVKPNENVYETIGPYRSN